MNYDHINENTLQYNVMYLSKIIHFNLIRENKKISVINNKQLICYKKNYIKNNS